MGSAATRTDGFQGSVGTSPLHTLQTATEWAGGDATPPAAPGMPSLIERTLLITTPLKDVGS